MDYDGYRDRFFQDPMPAPRFSFQGSFGLSLFYMDFQEAVSFYSEVLGPPSYVEGKWTRGWPIGDGWLTLLLGKGGNPANIEIAFEMEFPADAERLQRAFLDAGGQGQPPSSQLMYKPIHSCPVTDPFGVEILIIASL